MNKEPKILKKGESTFKNSGGSLCGGVVSKSLFDSNPMAYMMAYYMDDDKFETYKQLKMNKDKTAQKFFNEHARSAI